MLTLKTLPTNIRLLACVMSLLIVACSDGGGGGTQTAGGGTGGTGISDGSVTGFGSIFVNGVEFNTDNATYIRNGVSSIRPSSTPDANYILKLGMNAEVRGEITSATTGTANTVKLVETVRGKLLSAPTGSASAGTITVLGQTVHVDDTTKYDSNTSFAALPASTGQVFEIHGKRDFDGSILASYIEKNLSVTTFSVRGTISSHNFAAHTFSIGSLLVDYTTNASVFSDMPAPTNASNWNGLYVSVAGLASGCSTNPCGTFIANDVEPIGVSLSSASQVELEGLVTSLTSTADFMVDFQRVQTNVSTIYSGGVAADVLAGTKLEVEGSLSAGVITATKVRFKDNVVIDANAIAPTGINSGNLTLLEIEGMPGVTVSANFLTKFDNGSIASAANLSSLYGKSVRIRGRLNSGGSGGLVIATRIQDHGAANTTGNMSLTAYVPKNLALTGPTFSMLGLLTIDTSAPSPNFKNDQGLSINSATFFVTLKNGAMVTAVHQLSDSLVSNSAFLPGALKEVQLGDSQD